MIIVMMMEKMKKKEVGKKAVRQHFRSVDIMLGLFTQSSEPLHHPYETDAAIVPI